MGLFAPICCFGLLFVLARRLGLDVRRGLLAAAVTWGVFVTAITELLSVFHALTPVCVFWAWTIGAAGMGAAMVLPAARVQQVRRSPRSFWARLPAAERRMLVATALLVISMFVVGLVSAPSNVDSMAYHLARVMHWMVNHSIEHYCAGYSPQLYQPPWAEMVILHFQLLTDSDRFAFLVQWGAVIVCVAGASLIARQIGTAARGEALTAVFVITLPGTVFQAYSTQNNLVVAAWMICAIVAILWLDRPASTTKRLHVLGCGAMFGASTGLAVLTKGTAYMFSLPLLGWFIPVAVWRAGRTGMAAIAVAALIAASLNAGHWSRDWRLYRWPLMPPDHANLHACEAHTPALIASTIIRNVALHFWGPLPLGNRLIVRTSQALHRTIGISDRDPRSTFPGHAMETMPNWYGEDVCGDPLHLLLLLWAAGAVFVGSVKSVRVRDALFLLSVSVIGFLIFSAMLRWTMFHARLHLPLFVVVAPFVGAALESISRRRIAHLLAWTMLLMAFLIVMLNPGHPLVGRRSIFHQPREAQYFANRPGLYEPYRRAADSLAARGCREVGITSGPVYEYPLWVMLRNREGRWPNIRSVTPSPPIPGGIAPDPSEFCAIVAIPPGASSDAYPLPSIDWPVTSLGDGVKLLLRR